MIPNSEGFRFFMARLFPEHPLASSLCVAAAERVCRGITRFARGVAADKPNVFALTEGNRRAVEDDLSAVLEGKVVRARDDCG